MTALTSRRTCHGGPCRRVAAGRPLDAVIIRWSPGWGRRVRPPSDAIDGTRAGTRERRPRKRRAETAGESWPANAGHHSRRRPDRSHDTPSLATRRRELGRWGVRLDHRAHTAATENPTTAPSGRVTGLKTSLDGAVTVEVADPMDTLIETAAPHPGLAVGPSGLRPEDLAERVRASRPRRRRRRGDRRGRRGRGRRGHRLAGRPAGRAPRGDGAAVTRSTSRS